mgnify:CR=1 FL=1
MDSLQISSCKKNTENCIIKPLDNLFTVPVVRKRWIVDVTIWTDYSRWTIAAYK